MDCTESPAAVVGKMYPRGNHWAVGHLMGKKSIESLQETNRDHLTAPETAVATDTDLYSGLMEALMQQKNEKLRKPQTVGSLLRQSSGWREEDRDKYLREMSEPPLLALKLQELDST
ncbi:uncharacterized protein V6R79_002519 [Siganus canaliculatus]